MSLSADSSSAPFLVKNLVRAVLCSLLLLVPATAVLAQSNANPSGLPLPRFASTRSQPINVRVGPGTRYDVAWVFVKAGLPVEIIQEFDTWRKIRDLDGQEGWVHQNLLVGNRVAYVTPWVADNEVALRSGPSETDRVRAWLTSRLLVQLDDCNGEVCEISTRDESGRSFSGFVGQSDLWGVYPDEEVD